MSMMTVTLKERLRNIRHGQKVFVWEMKRERERNSGGIRGELAYEQPTGKTLEEVDALFAKDEAILSRFNHQTEEKPDVHEAEVAG
jgi:hypothetical protein